jgi:hypothetical protein
MFQEKNMVEIYRKGKTVFFIQTMFIPTATRAYT